MCQDPVSVKKDCDTSKEFQNCLTFCRSLISLKKGEDFKNSLENSLKESTQMPNSSGNISLLGSSPLTPSTESHLENE